MLLSKQFNLFNVAKKKNIATDGKLVFIIKSYGYILRNQRTQGAYIRPFVELTCYLIEGGEIKIQNQEEYQKTRKILLEPNNYNIVWKQTACSEGSALNFSELANNPSLVKQNFEDACNITINVLFCSLIGIKAY